MTVQTRLTAKRRAMTCLLAAALLGGSACWKDRLVSACTSTSTCEPGAVCFESMCRPMCKSSADCENPCFESGLNASQCDHGMCLSKCLPFATAEDAGADAGHVVAFDASLPFDAGFDANAGVDAGAGFDAGGLSDAGVPADAGVVFARAVCKPRSPSVDESSDDWYWVDSSGTIQGLRMACPDVPRGINCSDRDGCCGPAGVAINGACVPYSLQGGTCYASPQCEVGLSCNNHVCMP